VRVRAWAALAAALAAAAAAGWSPADPAATDPGRDRRALARLDHPPLGLPPLPLPSHGPVTAPQIRVGRKLFLDRRLSRNGTMSCAMCHVPEQGFASNELSTAVGMHGAVLPRNAPTLLNAAYAGPFFHDGREPDLDLQPFDVFLNPKEMDQASLGAAVARVRSLPEYEPLFEAAFGGPPTVETIGRALGAYVRTLLAADSPFDRWRFGGDEGALGEAARRGFELFSGKGGCSGCHRIGDRDALFTDHEFHDTGIGASRAARAQGSDPVPVEIAPGVFARLDRASIRSVGDPAAPDFGRMEITGDPTDLWSYKTPMLRNVARTAPYMHDGSLATLREVVEHYSRGAFPHAGLDPRVRPLGLSPREIDDLVAFLESLTGSNLEELVRDARSEPVGNFGSPARP
jgi:cytochrome c peroxidase